MLSLFPNESPIEPNITMSAPLSHSYAPPASSVLYQPGSSAGHRRNCPTGSLELFLLACNLSTDQQHDRLLAQSGYQPRIGPPESKTVKKEHPFEVPLEKVIRVKQEPQDD
jgi:hypothetical protein